MVLKQILKVIVRKLIALLLHLSADVLKTFPNEKVSNIRQAIRQKLANSAKTLKKKK